MSNFSEELQSLSPSALIELFVLDLSTTPAGGQLYFHAGTNELRGPVIWQGQTYAPWPIEATGFDITTQGSLPRPKLSVANVDGLFSGEVQANNDLLGCMVVRKRTFAKFLDAANFIAGNPNADPSQHSDDDRWYIDQKTAEDRYILEFELASVFDLMGVQLPYRQVLKSACSWRYRGPECSYTGFAKFDRFDKPTDNPLADICSKRLSSCKLRFGTNPLPYGGFPGATRYDN